ncbi:hypothetical protein DNTS_014671 [Danionella cerebrum]|uniref:Spondin domain-containing protein n=1 Tax=Danionella cerebrum TaxID=2873325 RepID=A0A553Q1X7_9TELE|nr:hypothetical protein DNTS_014671 [Danionella translucida]
MMSSEIFVPGWLQQLLVVLLRFTLSCTALVNPSNGSECSARGPASYILVFTGHWSPQTFPKQYPLFRPPAQWSKLMAVTHSEQYRLWEQGAPASEGMKSFAELGLTADLVKDAKEARKMRAVGSMYRTAGIASGVGHSSTELLLTPRSPLHGPPKTTSRGSGPPDHNHSLFLSGSCAVFPAPTRSADTDPFLLSFWSIYFPLSLIVKLIPSPDWFVGLDGLNLCEGGQWKQEMTLDLHPFDAGTDSGFTFSSPNFPTTPPDNITMITSQKPNHPANSFYYPRLAELPPLASVWVRRQGRSPVRQQNRLSNHILPDATKPHRFSGGLRHRTRYILLKPANSGSACPELEEQEECTPHNCLSYQ